MPSGETEGIGHALFHEEPVLCLVEVEYDRNVS